MAETHTSGISSDLSHNTNNAKPGEEKTSRFSISDLWTGSAADYDAPSLQYIGTGEGAQVFGRGLYAADQREIAEWYAERDAESKNRAKILYDGKEHDSDWVDNADFSGEPTEYEIKNTVLDDVRRRHGSITGALVYYEIQMRKSATVRETPEFYKLCFDWLTENQNRISFIEKWENLTGLRNLCKQTFWPDKEENLLLWNERVPEEQIQAVMEGVERIAKDVNGETFYGNRTDFYRAQRQRGYGRKR